jgi:photosystem II stability/assembly factor-like uncharacterized protein
MRNVTQLLRRSTDSGRHWQTLPAAVRLLSTLQASSAQVAWALTTHGQVIRTADGGQSWAPVLTSGQSQLPSQILAVTSTTAASLVVTLTRGHVQHHAAYTDLMVFRTFDGGATWRPTVVFLPSGGR